MSCPCAVLMHEWCAQEIKAKEMEELAKTLAELGIAAPAAGDEESAEAEEKRKKKKKDKKGKAAEGNGEVPPPETNGTAKENEPMEEPEEEDSSESLDPAEVRSSCFLGLAASLVPMFNLTQSMQCCGGSSASNYADCICWHLFILKKECNLCTIC